MPPSIKQQLKKRDEMAKEISNLEKDGHVDKELVRKYRKHRNFCNRMLKKAILEARGINITSKSSLNQIWKVIAEVLRPEMLACNQMKIMINGEPSEDPKVLAEEFVKYFKHRKYLLLFPKHISAPIVSVNVV